MAFLVPRNLSCRLVAATNCLWIWGGGYGCRANRVGGEARVRYQLKKSRSPGVKFS
jgi:hypothetical protein